MPRGRILPVGRPSNLSHLGGSRRVPIPESGTATYGSWPVVLPAFPRGVDHTSPKISPRSFLPAKTRLRPASCPQRFRSNARSSSCLDLTSRRHASCPAHDQQTPSLFSLLHLQSPRPLLAKSGIAA